MSQYAPFALPGFMPNQTPNADAQVLANSDGSWSAPTCFKNDTPVEKIERVALDGRVEFCIESPRTEQFLDRGGPLLRVRAGRDVPAMMALRGDTRFRVTTPAGTSILTLRQIADVTP